jgi:hypothetical protein
MTYMAGSSCMQAAVADPMWLVGTSGIVMHPMHWAC